METENRASSEYFVVDLKHVFDALRKRVWLIIIISLLTAGIGFSIASFAVAPQYQSEIMLYVNNRDVATGSVIFSSSQLAAAQSLVKTYVVILKDQSTLEQVIREAELPYTYKQLSGMIQAGAVNDTEIMRVRVTAGDPYEAAEIANTIARVLPERISSVIKQASMVPVGEALPQLNQVSPSATNYTIIGFMAGLVLVAGTLAVLAVLDNTVHDEDYVVTTYHYPLLAVVPDLTEERGNAYGYGANRDTGERRQK